ncbi:MAG TPA: sigma-70 family RNA polymerase sigma factor [Acidimicrobiales bacterium]|nr:sigma-70 family RNA polymerase sigma factor [Acidimicrobiales bacterium]
MGVATQLLLTEPTPDYRDPMKTPEAPGPGARDETAPAAVEDIEVLEFGGALSPRAGRKAGSRDRSGRVTDFDSFFLAHYPRVVRSLTAIGGNREMAADATQEAFLKAYARWRRIRRYSAPEAWVRRVAINRMNDLRKAEERRRAREAKVAEPEGALDGAMDGVDADGDVTALLSRLPERQRAAMALYYVDDLSVREVAKVMKISNGAVKFHLNRGRSALAGLLEGEGSL